MALSCKWAPYGIHGTDQPWSIGGAHSHGCIRMHNHDVAEIFDWIKIGTPVDIVGTPYSAYYEEREQVGLGSRGSTVVLVQQQLRELGYYKGTVDGEFREETRKSLIKFQKDHGFEPDGIVSTDIYPAIGL
jgi:N-acetyl-anhydromuramyl-L-alanine amidase AmpD